MVLHLERKFTSPTEIFIADQINFQKKYKNIVFTGQHLNNLNITAEIFEYFDKSIFSLKLITWKQHRFFKDVYEHQKPDIIHGHFLTDSSYFHPLTKKFNIPKVCSGYGYDVSKFPKNFGGLGKYYVKRIFEEYDLVLAMSNDMAIDLSKLGCPEQKIKVHYHGINTRLFNVDRNYSEKEVFNLLTIASLVTKKGHITVLKALTMLKKMHPRLNVIYTIVGKGPLLESLKKFVYENNLTNNVLFKGHVKHGEEFLELLRNADIFIHPSITGSNGDKEGIPGTIVQAMASGLPVLSTYHAGIPEIINSGVNGLLIKEKDSLTLAEYLYELCSNSRQRQYLGMNAANMAINELDVRIKTKMLIRIYDELTMQG